MPKILQSLSKISLLVLLLFLNPLSSLEAQNLLKKANLVTSIGGIISSDTTTPFLLRSNQYGLVPFKSGIGFFNVNLSQNYDSLFTLNKKLKRFGYGYGFELHTNLGKVNQLILPVAHLKVRFGAFEFYAGRRREIQGLVDTIGTMGSYIWSGNALPMPKVEISIPNYTPILENGWISIKGNFAHGWFGKGDSVQNVWLHQKSFYARIGKPSWKIHLIGGFNHQVQWGGYPTKPFFDELSGQKISKFNTDFNTYFKVITGVSLNNKGQGVNTGSPSSEALNRAGNHLGSIDIGLDIVLSKYRILIYRQSFYEDGSLYYLNNISDGLYGISLTKSQGYIKLICLEYLNTQNQGGNVSASGSLINELRGKDNYFNNSTYNDNWIYKNHILGTPYFIKTNQLNNSQMNNLTTRFSSNFILNNRVNTINSTLMFNFNEILLTTKYSYSRNLGNYVYPFTFNQNSILITTQTSFKANIISLKFSTDLGTLWKYNYGIKLEIRRNLTF